jgi:phosphoglycerol transferase MdoB-like AlkP superfamily enzyme
MLKSVYLLHLSQNCIMGIQRIKVLLQYGIFWLLFFISCRFLFLIYNFPKTIELPVIEIGKTFIHGIKLDISLTGYLLFFASLMLSVTFSMSGKSLARLFKYFTIPLLVSFSLIAWVDVELYKNWGFRIDSTILLYLKTPKESLASTKVWFLILLLTLTFATIWLTIKGYRRYIGKKWAQTEKSKWYAIPIFIFVAALMIIPIRGGVGIAPINVGTVFFSKEPYANHAAINVQWNFLKSLTEMNKNSVPRLVEPDTAKKLVEQLLSKKDTLQTQLITPSKPNIIIIILESFTSNVIEPLGGKPHVTPGFNEWSKKGILFDRVFASGDRSDKGIVAILSGYPAQPTSSIIKYTSKTEKLPQISKILMSNGYSSAFYYGGEINFANMNSYFVSGGYEELITLSNFPKKDLNSKWGAHDHVVFSRLLADIEKADTPFFKVMFSLSSHDPFDVPHKSRFAGLDWSSRYLNSIHYTDSCLNDFLNKAMETDWWKNTWILLVADHGVMYPVNTLNNAPEKYKIPMLWLGGALNIYDTAVSSTLSQTDIPLMITNQLGIEDSSFIFSKDVLFGGKSFAYYAYNNGFGFFTDTTGFVWDNNLHDFIGEKPAKKLVEDSGKGFFQEVMRDFIKK